MLSKRGAFDVRHPFAVEGYMRRALLNLVCDHVRQNRRRPTLEEMPTADKLPSDPTRTPLDSVLASEVEAQYRAALEVLRPKERDLVVARIEHLKSPAEIKRQFGFPSTGATYVAVSRALARLAQEVASRRSA
jgi:DNA-directed RNA polymerase specialized sigma24 family protein